MLVVDDDHALASTLGRSLAYFGLDITLANSGHDALRHLESKRFDVVLLDFLMPGMNGLDVLREASGSESFPPTIIHSAYVDVPTAVEAMQAGACEVVQKPVAAAELARRIRELVVRDGGQEACPQAIAQGAEAKLLLGSSPQMCQLRAAVRRVASFRDLSVLIEGETGTGKELVARSIHALGAPDQPFLCVNCAAIPAELFESEIFGHEAGAFTNAKAARVGLLEEAGAGVLFLDEVGELPIALQAKLLRVLETGEFRRLGSGRMRHFAARVVSATNRRLSEADGAIFRSDLYFRIAGYTVRTPSLREHPADVPMLAEHFCRAFCERHGSPPVGFSDEAMAALCAFEWPGNVRQLRAVVHNAVIHADNHRIRLVHLAELLSARPPKMIRASSGAVRRSLPDVERDMMLAAYTDTGENLTRAAARLGIPRTTLRDRLKRYGML